MYGFITHTWNTVKGECPHGCSYCYMKRFGEQAELHFDEAELKTDLGENNFIFVGSSCDMWALDVPSFEPLRIRGRWVHLTIMHCRNFPKNKYLLQSKNPKWILAHNHYLSKKNFIIGTTIETNRVYPEMGQAPSIRERVRVLRQIKAKGFKTMITIEPIMDFDVTELVNLINIAKPDSINIGADSQGHGLPEPSPEKIKWLIPLLARNTKILPKTNLKRLL